MLLPGLDSAQTDCAWGRLSLRCQLEPESILTVWAFASNQDAIIRNNEVVRADDFLLAPEVPKQEKERLFLLADGLEHSGVQDVLLAGQNGRWFWLWLEITGEGSNVLEDLRVYVPGNNFFRTFPQVYQNSNEFLQRYLSIFPLCIRSLRKKLMRCRNFWMWTRPG